MVTFTRAIRVRPGASRTVVGGTYGDGDHAALVVRVRERAVDGRASEAAVRAVAAALGLSTRCVRLNTVGSSRTKTVTIDTGSAADSKVLARWSELMSRM